MTGRPFLSRTASRPPVDSTDEINTAAKGGPVVSFSNLPCPINVPWALKKLITSAGFATNKVSILSRNITSVAPAAVPSKKAFTTTACDSILVKASAILPITLPSKLTKAPATLPSLRIPLYATKLPPILNSPSD